MNFKKVFTIYKKELLDLMRDRRTVITAVVVPLIMYPLMMIGVSSLMMRQEKKLDDQIATICVIDNVQDKNSAKIIQQLENFDKFQLMPYVAGSGNLIEDNIVKAIITISDSINTSNYQIIKALISYNAADEKSEKVYRQLKNKLDTVEQILVSERLQKIQIDTDILNAVEIIQENIAPPEQMFGLLVSKMLPYMLILLMISGGAVVASDLIAGEKERKTLETILVSAAHRNELVFGKYLTVITISLITVCLNLVSLYFSLHHLLSQVGMDMVGIQLPIGNFALILLLMLPLATLFSAILISISTYSRNIKEAQSLQMPLMFASMMAAMISMFPAIELNLGMALIPVVNFALLFKEIIMGNFQLNYFLIVLGSTLLLDVIAIYFSVKLFNNESILFRTTEEKSLKFWGKNKKNIFNPQFIMLFFIAISLALFYLGGKWQAADLPEGLIRTQLFIILLPTIFVLRISKSDIKKVLRFNPTNPLNFGVVLLLSIPVMIIVGTISQLINIIFPFPENYLEMMKNLVQMNGISTWKLLFIIAVLPGVCEEIMFRGFIINAFTKKGFWYAIIVTGVLFGIMHLDPFRLIPVTILGIWMGYLLLKTNTILIPIFAHFINNALAILLGKYGESIPIINKLIVEQEFSWWLIIPAILAFVWLLKIFDKINKNNTLSEVA